MKNQEKIEENCDFEEVEDDDFWDDDDICYECTGYGDDYYIDEDGELQCRCFECPFFPAASDWD